MQFVVTETTKSSVGTATPLCQEDDVSLTSVLIDISSLQPAISMPYRRLLAPATRELAVTVVASPVEVSLDHVPHVRRQFDQLLA